MSATAATLPRRGIAYLWDLLRELVVRELKIRYKRSILGLAWSLITPLLQLLVLSFTFRVVVPLGIENYTLFLFVGIVVWSWFQASIHMASSSVLDNRSLLRQPGFPPGVVPVVTVLTNLVHFLLALAVLLPMVLFPQPALSWTVVLLPAVVAVQFALILSLAYPVAALHVRFRDTQHIVAVLLMLGFYLTPVFYDAGKVPEAFQMLYNLNPLVHVLEGYRAILVRGEVPRVLPLAIVTLASLAMLAAGHAYYRRASERFVEEL